MTTCARDLRAVAKFIKDESDCPVSMAVCDRAADYVDQSTADNVMLRSKLRDCSQLFHEISCALSNRIRSERAFNKYETIADSGRAIAERAIRASGGPDDDIEKLQYVFDCAKDFLENHRSEVFGELTQDALENAIDAMNNSIGLDTT